MQSNSANSPIASGSTTTRRSVDKEHSDRMPTTVCACKYVCARACV